MDSVTGSMQLEKAHALLLQYGFDMHRFQVGNYNTVVNNSLFVLPYSNSTVAAVLISKPDMFESSFLSWLTSNYNINCEKSRLLDPLDSSVRERIGGVLKECDLASSTEIIFDYELQPGTRRPRAIMQVAAHVSGAAYYYRREELDNGSDPFDSDEKIYGVCLHPKYGGWFAIRALLIFRDVNMPDLIVEPPKKLLNTAEEISELLRRFNRNWQDNTFRDVHQVLQKYSAQQILYFNTKPSDRFDLIDRWMQDGSLQSCLLSME